MQHPRDFALAAEICVAEQDGRECSWYTVYNRVLRDFIFTNCDGERCICSITPQYSLVAKYDTGHSPETDAIEARVASVNAPLLRPPQPTVSQLALPQHSSDVIMRSPTDHDDSVRPTVPRIPVNSAQWNSNSPLSSISSGSLPRVMDRSPSLDHAIALQPQTPTISKNLDGDSPLTPLPESWAAAVPRSHASRTVPLPVSPTPAETKSTVSPPGVTRVLRRSHRLTRCPLIPAQRSLSEIPETPPRDKKTIVMKSTRIPDFIAALHVVPTPCPSPKAFPKEFALDDDEHITTRTILIVEIKSALTYAPNIWRRIWDLQVNAQAYHTFQSYADLDCLGVIIAVGRRWIYVNVHRPPPDGLTHSQRRDPDYLPSPGDWSDTSSDATSEIVESSPLPQDELPFDLLKPLMDPVAPEFILSQPNCPPGQAYIESYLLDPEGQSELFFKKILWDLRHHNQSIWK